MPTPEEVLAQVQEQQSQIIKLAEQMHAAFKQIDEQKALADSVHSLALSVERLTVHQRNTADQLLRLQADVSEIKNQPGKRWDLVLTTIHRRPYRLPCQRADKGPALSRKEMHMEENKDVNLIKVKKDDPPCTCDNCINQPRYRSVAAWASLLALVGMMLGTFGGYEKLGITDADFQTIINMLLSALVAFGVLNNPTSKSNF